MVFILLLLIFVIITNQRYQIIKEKEQLEMSGLLHVVKQNIEQSLKSSYLTTLTLALTINHQGVPENFDVVARQLIQSNPSLHAVELVPGGIIKYIYPLKGNKNALNTNIFKLSELISHEAKMAIKSKKMHFAGPIPLQQDGIGIVGRLPVFIKDKFWGFSAVVIKLQSLLKHAGIENTDKYYFQFSKVNPITKKEAFYLTGNKNFTKNTYLVTPLSEGDWKLYIIKSNNKELFSQMIPPMALGLLLALVCSYLVLLILRRPAQLQLLLQKQAARLYNSEIQFKTIFDHAAIGIARINSQTGMFLQANQKLCEMLGYSYEEMYEMNFQGITHPDDLVEDLRLMELLNQGISQEFKMQKRLLNKRGEFIWVNLTVSTLGHKGEALITRIAIIEDISARKAAENELITSQQKISTLINTIDGIVWEADPHTFKFSFISKRVEDILGYTADEWLNADTFWADHIHDDDREWVSNYCHDAIREGKKHDFEYRMIARDGSVVWLRDIVNIITENNKTVNIQGIMIDITKNMQSEIDLKNSFKLVTAQNMRLLNFSYIISHNLRSHSSNIQSIIDLIMVAKTAAEKEEMFNLLKKVSENLNETLCNLNEVVNIQTNIHLIIEPLNLSAYIQNTIRTLNAQIMLKHALIQNNVPNDVMVNYNPAYLESVLLNFLSNTIKYSHPDRNPVITLDCFIENKQTVLCIADNGIGIDLKKNRDKLFGMYKTFNNQPDSRGIGLFITKNQVDAMGGNIQVESTLGEGTKFKIYFK